MIGVFVKLRCHGAFDGEGVRTIAETARAKFEALPGLRSKAFTFNPDTGEVTNFYVWDTEDTARAFFTDAVRQRIAGLYGVLPTIEFVQVAALVENARVGEGSGAKPSLRPGA